MTILSFDETRKSNAALIVDVVELGHLRDGDRVLDATYGLGAFWKLWSPTYLTANDLFAREHDVALSRVDFRKAHEHWSEREFDVVVFDPPYGYRGTSHLESDGRYGIDGDYMSPDDRDSLIIAGCQSLQFVAHRVMLVKCQDQVVSGQKRWQTMMIAHEMNLDGWRLADQLHLCSYRAQPPGRRQVHAASNYSTLQVYVRRT